MKRSKEVDSYIKKFPEEVQNRLNRIRSLVEELCPEAEEKIGYGMPGYYLNGPLVYYAGYEKHIGLYPTPVGMEEFKQRLESYKTGKGSVQFPHDRELPMDLIEDVIRFRIKDNLQKSN